MASSTPIVWNLLKVMLLQLITRRANQEDLVPILPMNSLMFLVALWVSLKLSRNTRSSTLTTINFVLFSFNLFSLDPIYFPWSRWMRGSLLRLLHLSMEDITQLSLRKSLLSCSMIWMTPKWRTIQLHWVSLTASSKIVWGTQLCAKLVAIHVSSCQNKPRCSKIK